MAREKPEHLGYKDYKVTEAVQDNQAAVNANVDIGVFNQGKTES